MVCKCCLCFVCALMLVGLVWFAGLSFVNIQQLEYRLISFSELVLIIFKNAIF